MKFIRVNMTNKTIDTEDVPDAYKGLGGRGLTSVLINSEVPQLAIHWDRITN